MALVALEKDIKKAIKARLQPLPAQKVGDRIWTKEVFWAVVEYGESKHLTACYAGGKKDGARPEWLFDIVLYRDRPFSNLRPRRIRRLVLVGECEWNTRQDAQIYDFERLLVARADHRLFVFQMSTTIEIRERVKIFKSLVQNFPHSEPGDRYLFGGYAYDEGKMIWLSHIHA